MKLIDVRISGFRSIKDMTISLGGSGHKILVGKNESGKSNILKALRLLLDGTFDKLQGKTFFDKAFVLFQFELEKDESAKCRNVFMEKFFAKNDTKLTDKHTVKSFYDAYANRIFYSFYIGQGGMWRHSPLSKDIQITSNWHYVSQLVVKNNGLTDIDIPAGSYIHDGYIQKHLSAEHASKTLHPSLSATDASHIRSMLHSIINDTLKLPKIPLPTIYWEYSSKECDLPNAINMNSFSETPDTCLPLKAMFLLTDQGEKGIKKEILGAIERGPNGITSLLDAVSDATNIHIKENWQEYNKDYKNVRIHLQKDGDNISIGIKDAKNTYDFKERSDGFRRFISFLLLMTHTKNSLILLDEPETGLHPGSAKNLRDVLIRLGKDNIVVYATHSISMIDTNNIENNLIISKDGEDTSLKAAKEHGVSSGETVYRAIGHSIYDDLKKKNILLEGYTDKKILKSFMQKTELKEFGICYTGGVNHIGSVMSFLALASRECFILSDADNATTQKAKQFRKDYDFKHWYTYKDLDSSVIELEDFYTRNFFDGITKSMLKKHNIDVKIFPFQDIKDDNRLYSLQGLILKTLPDKKDLIEKILEDIKQECAHKATEKDIIAEKINLVLKKFLEKIKGDATE